MKTKLKRLKRGLAIEYALLLMMLAASFSALVLAMTTSSLKQTSAYETYVTQKVHLDELAALYIDYYTNDTYVLSPDEIAARAEEYGFSVTAFEKDTLAMALKGTVTVSIDSTVYLTLEFTPVRYKTTETKTFTVTDAGNKSVYLDVTTVICQVTYSTGNSLYVSSTTAELRDGEETTTVATISSDISDGTLAATAVVKAEITTSNNLTVATGKSADGTTVTTTITDAGGTSVAVTITVENFSLSKMQVTATSDASGTIGITEVSETTNTETTDSYWNLSRYFYGEED